MDDYTQWERTTWMPAVTLERVQTLCEHIWTRNPGASILLSSALPQIQSDVLNRLLERTRQRRELLAKKMAETSPTAAPRKRRTPLTEDTSQNVTVETTDQQTEESPKRPCLREEEQIIKADTPAVMGVKSRMHLLTSERSQWDDVSNDVKTSSGATPVPAPRSTLTKEIEVDATPRTRRGRLAMLAQNINNWEDDSDHPRNRLEKDKKPVRVWQPPKPAEPVSTSPAKPPRHFNSAKPENENKPPLPPSASSPSKYGVTANTGSPSRPSRVCERSTPSPGGRTSNRPTNRSSRYVSPSPSPSRKSDDVASVPEEREEKSVSKLTVLLGSAQDSCTGKISVSSGATRSSPNKRYSAESDAEPTKKSISARRAAWQQKDDSVSAKTSDNEPTSKPVSSRAACWEQRVTQAERDTQRHLSGSSVGNKTQPVKLPQPQLRQVSKSPVKGDAEPTKQPVHSRMATWEQKTVDADVSLSEPTAHSVHSRMTAWQQKDTPSKNLKKPPSGSSLPPRPPPPPPPASSGNTSSSSLPKGPAPVKPPRVEISPVKSPIKSPAKASSSISNMQKHLFGGDNKWKENEIAEKIRQQKQQDMQVLQDRWKNGVLRTDAACEGSGGREAENAPPVSPVKVNSSPAVNRPVHPVASLVKEHKSPAPSSPQNNVRSQKRENARQKMREEEEMDTAPPTGESYFENKLATMGFDIKSVSDLGHVATIDLKKNPKKAAEKKAVSDSSLPAEGSTSQSMTRSLSSVSNRSVGEAVTDRKEDNTVVHVDQCTLPKSYMPMGKDQSARNFESPTVRTLFQRMQARSGPASKTVKPVTTGYSLYNLVKKNQTSAPSSDVAESSYRSSGLVSGDKDKMVNVLSHGRRDSFDSESSFSEDERSELYTSQEDADYTQDDDDLSSHDDRRRESLTSTQSEYSDDREYATRQTTESYDTDADTDCTACNARDYTTDDYTETEAYTADETEEDMRTEDYSDSESDSDESGVSGVNALLDEAMDETTCEALPETRSMFVRPPSPEIKKVTFKKPAPLEHSSVFAEPVVRSESSDSVCSSASEDKTITYSVDMYRKSGNGRNAPPPKMTIVRHSQYSQHQAEEDPLPFIPAKNAMERIKALQELVNQEHSIIMQTSNALNKCCGKDSSFAGSQEQVECNRLLLLSCKKREAYLEQIQKLRDGKVPCTEGRPQGSLTISDIRLPLKRDFLNRRGTVHDNEVHYFLCMIRHNAHVIVTQMVCTHDTSVRSSLDFPNLIKLNNIQQDFHLELEIYGMSITKESQTQTPKKNKHCKLTPKKFFGLKSSGSHMPSPGGPNAVRTTNFVLISSLPITKHSLSKQQFSLNRVVFSSPLAGTIMLKQRCVMECHVQEKGFLTMFEDVSGFGAWHRRWCVLKNHALCYWKYPDDEFRKEPMGVIDLKRCITDVVGLIPRDICARPNTFELVTIRPQQDGEQDTLISRSYNTMTSIKHMVSADTKDDRLLWCDKINEALRNVRTWHSDAMGPIKRKPDTESAV